MLNVTYKQKHTFFVLFLLGIFLVAGCGNNPQDSSAGSDSGMTASGETGDQTSAWKVIDYKKIELPHPEGHTEYDGFYYCAVDQEYYYMLVDYKENDDEFSWYLDQVPLSGDDIICTEVTSLIRWGERQSVSAEQFPGLVSEEAVQYGTYHGAVACTGGADLSVVLRDVCPPDQQHFLQAAVQYSPEEYVLIFRDKTGDTIYRYQKDTTFGADGQNAEDRVVVIESAYLSLRSIQEAATVYTRTHPGISVMFECGEWEDREDNWTRMTMELVSGGGADILIVDNSQLSSLMGSNMLADMKTLIPEEELNQIYPEILKVGDVDGKLYSLITEAWTRTLFADKAVWNKAEWTLDDVIPMLDGTGKEFATSKNGNSVENILQQLVLYDLENSKFLNMKAGTCDFNSEEFQNLLVLCKELSSKITITGTSSLDEGKALSAMMSGNALAYECTEMTFKDYCQIRDLIGENYFTAGYPAENGRGNYWVWNYSVVVNANSENLDVISDILLMFLEESNVKRDAFLDGKVIEDWDGAKYYTLNNDVDNWFYPLKEDGTTYVEDYMAYLESCVLIQTEADDIRAIIIEEAAPFFYGDKDVKTVCGIIQNRAQLYLDER